MKCNNVIWECDMNTCFWPVKGMNLVRELEKDLKVANVICMVSIFMVYCFIIEPHIDKKWPLPFTYIQEHVEFLIHSCFQTTSTIYLVNRLVLFIVIFVFVEWKTPYKLIDHWSFKGSHCKCQFKKKANPSGIFLYSKTLSVPKLWL